MGVAAHVGRNAFHQGRALPTELRRRFDIDLIDAAAEDITQFAIIEIHGRDPMMSLFQVGSDPTIRSYDHVLVELRSGDTEGRCPESECAF